MSFDAPSFLQNLFGSQPAPEEVDQPATVTFVSTSVVTMTAPPQLEPDAIAVVGWDADDWPTYTVPPFPPCATCGSVDRWQTFMGEWRCVTCHPGQSSRVLQIAARLRAGRPTYRGA